MDAERRQATKSGKKCCLLLMEPLVSVFQLILNGPGISRQKRLSLDREFQRQRDVILSSLFFLLAPSGSLTIDDLSAKRPETLFLTFCKQL